MIILCTKCNIEKSIDDFFKSKTDKNGFNRPCKDCRREWWKEFSKREHQKVKVAKYSKQYYLLNKEKICLRSKEYRENNVEKVNLMSKNWAKKNIEKRKKISSDYTKRNREKINEHRRNRKKNDPSYKLRFIVSKAIWYYLKTQFLVKKNSCWLALPYSPKELKKHIESLWEPWMSWKNHGRINNEKKTWEIDHIIPQSELKYDSFEHPNFLKCWSLKNMRPMETKKHRKRYSKEKLTCELN